MTRSEVFVLVRISLYLLSGFAAAGGWLPADIAENIAMDREFIEVLTGIVMFAGTGIWYWFSDSRKALKEKLNA
jgi:hypothetical protein